MAQFDIDGRLLPGRLDPVCCAADIPATIIDRFLEANIEFSDGPETFVVVDSATEVYLEETEFGDMENKYGKTMTSAISPYKSKTPLECYYLLIKSIRETGSQLHYINFVIMDERSLADDTVLLVAADDFYEGRGDPEIIAFRVIFEVAQRLLVAYFDGEFRDAKQDQLLAQQAVNGVFTAQHLEMFFDQDSPKLPLRRID